jgi:putative salt-induced outer membrane protein YdiY
MNHSRNLTAGLAALICGLLPLAAMADVLHLSSGDRLTGEIDSVGGGKVILKTDFAGTIAVKLETVKHMESEKTFELRTEEGVRQSGQFAVTSDAQQFRTDDGDLTDLDLATVKTANENNLGMVNFVADWTNRFEAGISASTGNTETSAQNYLWNSELQQRRGDHRLNFTYNTQEDDNVKTKENLLAGYRYRRFFGERWYGLGNVGYQEDQFKGIDYRWTLGLGGGYQFWDDSTGALSTDLGVNYVMEELDGIKDENPALRWGVSWNRFFLSKRAEAFYEHSLLHIFADTQNTVYNGSTGVRFNLTDMLTANLRVDVAHETDPAPDREKTDVTYVIGVGLTL